MIDVKKMRELAKEAPHGPYISDGDGIRALVRDDLGRIIAVRHRLDGSEHQAVANYFAAVDPQTILALLDRLEAMEHEREDQNRYLAAQSAEIAGLKQRLAQQPSGEVTDSDIYTLLGHAELLRAEGQTDMPDWFLEFAWRLASGIDVTLAARVAEIRDSARAQGGKS